jgi:myo-inositol 2-dehydrogenase / D-chiro-inositol 1-dehydrogenase
MKVGVIGCGTIAYWGHLRSLRRLKGVTLAAIADPDPAARARAGPLVRGPLYADATELILSDVDAVVISAPPLVHAELAIAAARAGKHVYIEKPLATTLEDAHAVASVIARCGRVAAVGFNYRYQPSHARARTLLQQGCIGRVRAVQTAFCEATPCGTMPEWKRQRKSGGGVLLDLASHHIDLLRWFLDDEFATIEASIGSIETEHDTATLKLVTLGGVDIQAYFSLRAGPVDFLEFIGDTGSLRVDRHAVLPIVKQNRRGAYGSRSVSMVPTLPDAAFWLRRLAQPSYQPSFRHALVAFLDRIRGRWSPLPTIDDGVRSLAVVLAAEESAARMAPTTAA